jgi:hypothetical protein
MTPPTATRLSSTGLSGPATSFGSGTSTVAVRAPELATRIRHERMTTPTTPTDPNAVTTFTHTDTETDIVTIDRVVHTESHSDTVVRSKRHHVANDDDAEPALQMQSALDQSNAAMMGDAPACEVCGSITVRNATCYRCLNCGNSMGCS